MRSRVVDFIVVTIELTLHSSSFKDKLPNSIRRALEGEFGPLSEKRHTQIRVDRSQAEDHGGVVNGLDSMGPPQRLLNAESWQDFTCGSLQSPREIRVELYQMILRRRQDGHETRDDMRGNHPAGIVVEIGSLVAVAGGDAGTTAPKVVRSVEV